MFKEARSPFSLPIRQGSARAALIFFTAALLPNSMFS